MQNQAFRNFSKLSIDLYCTNSNKLINIRSLNPIRLLHWLDRLKDICSPLGGTHTFPLRVVHIGKSQRKTTHHTMRQIRNHAFIQYWNRYRLHCGWKYQNVRKKLVFQIEEINCLHCGWKYQNAIPKRKNIANVYDDQI